MDFGGHHTSLDSRVVCHYFAGCFQRRGFKDRDPKGAIQTGADQVKRYVVEQPIKVGGMRLHCLDFFRQHLLSEARTRGPNQANKGRAVFHENTLSLSNDMQSRFMYSNRSILFVVEKRGKQYVCEHCLPLFFHAEIVIF